MAEKDAVHKTSFSAVRGSGWREGGFTVYGVFAHIAYIFILPKGFDECKAMDVKIWKKL